MEVTVLFQNRDFWILNDGTVIGKRHVSLISKEQQLWFADGDSITLADEDYRDIMEDLDNQMGLEPR